MEKIGSLLIEKGPLSVPDGTGQEDEQENLQGRRRILSNRLERARRHLDMCGRREGSAREVLESGIGDDGT